MPNIILIQDLVRNAFNQYLKAAKDILSVIISLKKGTYLYMISF